MSQHIPPPRRPDDTPPIRTQSQLEEQWRSLMGPLGFSQRSIWMMLLDQDRRVEAALVKIDDLPREPADADAEGLVRLLEHIRDGGGGSVAFLVTRPGRGGMSATDRAWASMLTDATRRAGLEPLPVHRANDRELVVCSPDDLAA